MSWYNLTLTSLVHLSMEIPKWYIPASIAWFTFSSGEFQSEKMILHQSNTESDTISMEVIDKAVEAGKLISDVFKVGNDIFNAPWHNNWDEGRRNKEEWLELHGHEWTIGKLRYWV